MFFLGAIAALTGTDLYLKEYFEKRDPADFPREMEGTKGRGEARPGTTTPVVGVS